MANAKTPLKTPAKTPTKKAKLQATSAKKESAKKVKLPPSEIDPTTYVSKAKMAESLSVVMMLKERFTSLKEFSEKKELFEADTSFVNLQVELKKIPLNFSTFIHAIPLPAHWRHSLPVDTCLIVPDLNREPLDDRDLDLEQTKAKYVDKLEEAEASDLVKEILPMRQLRNEFRPHALRQKLSSEFSVFLCDHKLLRNKYSFLSRFLGKAFWVDQKKVPLMIDFSLEPAELRRQIEDKLNQTNLYVSGKGSSLFVTVGSLEQKPKELLTNLQTVLGKVNEIFGDNVRALTLKTVKSESVTFFMDLGSSNSITLARGSNKDDEEEEKEDRFVEDEFDFLTNSSVRVFRDGTIRVVKRKTPDDEEEVPEGEEEEKADAGEEAFIKSINRTQDHEWVRRKVNNVRMIRKGAKRLLGTRMGHGGKRFFTRQNKNKKVSKKGRATSSKKTTPTAAE